LGIGITYCGINMAVYVASIFAVRQVERTA